METAFQTDCGKVRPHNEDNGGLFYNQKNLLLALVADGMGGHRAGDVASALALDFIKDKWEQTTDDFTEEQARVWLDETVKQANNHVLSYGLDHPECEGMGTTVVAALCKSEFAVIAHVGDSRCYVLQENGLRQVTEDHSLVNELARRGEITYEEAAIHPQKNVVTQALGTIGEIVPDTRTINWRPQDMLLLCSDGLTDVIRDEQIEKVLRLGDTIQEKADHMVQEANDAGGIDNITLVLVTSGGQAPAAKIETDTDSTSATKEGSE